MDQEPVGPVSSETPESRGHRGGTPISIKPNNVFPDDDCVRPTTNPVEMGKVGQSDRFGPACSQQRYNHSKCADHRHRYRLNAGDLEWPLPITK